MTNIKRLYLLSESEIENLYARPDFNSDERELYFAMNQIELDALVHQSLRLASDTKATVNLQLTEAFFGD